MNIKPLSDRVLIEPIAQEDKTKTGIVLPDTAEKERPEQGKIVAVGPGKLLENGKRQTIDVKKGNKVIFSKFGPSEIKIDGKEYLIARTDDILAIIG
jgi:chaperonin GroES